MLASRDLTAAYSSRGAGVGTERIAEPDLLIPQAGPGGHQVQVRQPVSPSDQDGHRDAGGRAVPIQVRAGSWTTVISIAVWPLRNPGSCVALNPCGT